MSREGWTLSECVDRGCLPTGEPIEALYGTGWWTEQEQEQEPWDVCECPQCHNAAYIWPDGSIDCERCKNAEGASQ